MATWTDGAAYAPTERPDGFASPEVAPLAAAPPEPARTPGPFPPPAHFAPGGPQTPLEVIRDAAPARRNPTQPFETTSALLTADGSGPGAGRDPRTPFVGQGQVAASLPPPSGPPLALSADPPPQAAWPPPAQPGAFQPRQERSSSRTLMSVAGVCLLLGLVIPGTTSWLITVAGLLLLRTRRFTGPLSTTALITGVSLLALQLIFGDLGALSDLACLGLLIWTTLKLHSLTKQGG